MKELFFSKTEIERIIEQVPTPFHIYDESGIRNTARALNAAFAWNKGYKEYFAVKALPNPEILRILAQEGCGADCASKAELLLAEMSGITGEQIMFSSNMTPAEEFVCATELGAIINLDDITHVEYLEKCAGIPKTVSCRYNPGGAFKIGNAIMGDPSEAKYGMTRPQLMDAYRMLRQKGAETFGLHAFLSSNTTDDRYYPTLAAQLFELTVDIKKETGIELSFINLSGGVGIPYRPDEKPVDISKVGEGVRAEYERILGPTGIQPAIYTECGRYMTGPHGALVTTVIHKKEIYKNHIGVDACAANLMRPAMYGAYHHITVLGKENAPRDHKYDVVGSLCENNDKFAVDRMLPKIEIGDIIAIHDTGAHGFSMGYNYNGKLRSAEVLLCADGSWKLIRRAETVNDYFATLTI
ncbi:MAG: diaminopimelate decarboxylase [Lawsonibacter sp.]|nr:diaminopimelate decarboxylase [Lawsonibacter sp.]